MANMAAKTGSAVSIRAVCVGVVSFWAMVCPPKANAEPSTAVNSSIAITYR
jgi:hypothetical protein